MELTREFLLQKAHQWGLTNEQEEVLVLKFGEEQSNQDISERLGISINACVQCLGEIYKKAGIIGRSRGKAHRLRSELLREAERTGDGLVSVEYAARDSGLRARKSSISRRAALRKNTNLEGEANLQDIEDWLEEAQQKVQDLSVNPDRGAVDEALQSLSDLPTLTKALASESQWERVEVVQKLLQQVVKLFTTLKPSLDKFDGLSFLKPSSQLGNPIHRSIIAFIQRVTQQLKLDVDPLEINEKVLKAVLEEGDQLFQDASMRPSRENPNLKTYPAWVRKTCLKILSSYLDNWPDRERNQLVDTNIIDRNLMAVDTSILEMYLSAKKDDFVDFNYFDILVARWMKNTPWRKKKVDRSPSDHEHPIILSIDPVDLEWASLSALRRRYHALGKMRKYDSLRNYFIEDCLKAVKEEDTAHFWINYEEFEISSKDDYKILGIPRSLLGHNNENVQECEELAQDVRRYCELAAFNTLDQEKLKELNTLLDKACQYPILDFWFNEIDHFMDHCLAEVERPTNGYSTGKMSRV